jgi:DNA polymerase V
MISDKSELESRVSDFAAMCAKKLREEGSVAYDVTTFLYTNRFREDLQQYFPSMSIRLPVAANSAQEIVGTALKAFRLIYRSEYQYKKAGVVVSNIIPAESVQGTIFDFDQQARQKNDRISEVIDKLGGQSRLLRLAAQRPGHYADGIRSEHCSGLYTTSIEDIIKVR